LTILELRTSDIRLIAGAAPQIAREFGHGRISRPVETSAAHHPESAYDDAGIRTIAPMELATAGPLGASGARSSNARYGRRAARGKRQVMPSHLFRIFPL
jgi:hypothetical protein